MSLVYPVYVSVYHIWDAYACILGIVRYMWLWFSEATKVLRCFKLPHNTTLLKTSLHTHSMPCQYTQCKCMDIIVISIISVIIKIKITAQEV